MIQQPYPNQYNLDNSLIKSQKRYRLKLYTLRAPRRGPNCGLRLEAWRMGGRLWPDFSSRTCQLLPAIRHPSLGRLGSLLGALWGHPSPLERLKRFLGALGRFLGRPEGILDASWRAFWRAPGVPNKQCKHLILLFTIVDFRFS